MNPDEKPEAYMEEISGVLESFIDWGLSFCSFNSFETN